MFCDYIQYHVAGSDQAFLVDIELSKIKEISSERYDFLKKQKIKVKAVKMGNQLKFVSTVDPTLILFSLRVKIRKAERKFYVETGNMLY